MASTACFRFPHHQEEPWLQRPAFVSCLIPCNGQIEFMWKNRFESVMPDQPMSSRFFGCERWGGGGLLQIFSVNFCVPVIPLGELSVISGKGKKTH